MFLTEHSPEHSYLSPHLNKYGYNMVANGDYFSTPDSVNNSITGNITLIVELNPTSWTPATVQVLLAKDNVSATTRSYSMSLQTSGVLRFNFSLDGTAITSVDSTVATGFTNWQKRHVAVERDSTTGDVRFYTGVNWINFTQLGTTVTSTTGSIFDSTTQLQFGNLSSLGYELQGKIYDSEIYTGFGISNPAGSVLKVNFDPNDYIMWSSTWTSFYTGEVWTINGNAKVAQ